MLGHHPGVGVPTAKQSSVNFGMQRLQSSAHDLWEPRVFRHLSHWQPVACEESPRATSGQQCHTVLYESPRKFNDSTLVRDAEQRTRNNWHVKINLDIS